MQHQEDLRFPNQLIQAIIDAGHQNSWSTSLCYEVGSALSKANGNAILDVDEEAGENWLSVTSPTNVFALVLTRLPLVITINDSHTVVPPDILEKAVHFDAHDWNRTLYVIDLHSVELIIGHPIARDHFARLWDTGFYEETNTVTATLADIYATTIAL